MVPLERVLHAIGDDARQRIGRAAGWKSDHHGERACRKGLGFGARLHGRKCDYQCAGKTHAIHGIPLGIPRRHDDTVVAALERGAGVVVTKSRCLPAGGGEVI